MVTDIEKITEDPLKVMDKLISHVSTLFTLQLNVKACESEFLFNLTSDKLISQIEIGDTL